jgi:SSS family solute:Na+ symporter
MAELTANVLARLADGEQAGLCCDIPAVAVSTPDIIVIVAYFSIVFGIGAYFFTRAKTSRSYFLADRSVGWVAVGASLFATNISSEHFIGLAGSGASTGLAVGHFEWLAVLMTMILAWVFVPFYLRSGVYTMPEFLERRYGPACRWYLTTVSVLAYIFTKISVSLYAGSLVLRQVVG